MYQEASGSIDDMESNNIFITRQDILNFPFPYKLWLVVKLGYACLRWNPDGTVVLLDLTELQGYLNSPRSIFKIKNCSTFLEHLKEFQFEPLNPSPKPAWNIKLQYKNENFQRDRRDLLAKMRRQNVGGQPSLQPLQAQGPSIVVQQQPHSLCRISERMPGDLCFMSHGTLSNIQRKRMEFQTLLDFQTMTNTLQEKLQASSDAPGQNSEVIELPADTFENPLESVLRKSEEDRAEYAGYYGNCGVEQVKRFFGDYLPMYEDDSKRVKKIVTEAKYTKSYNPVPKPIIADVKQRDEEQQLYQEDEDCKFPGFAPILPMQALPDLSPMEALPDLSPMQALPDLSPMEALPDLLPMQALPDLSPMLALPDLSPMLALPDLSPMEALPDLSPMEALPDLSPMQALPDLSPMQALPDLSPMQALPDLSPMQPLPDLSPMQALPELSLGFEPFIIPDLYNEVISQDYIIASNENDGDITAPNQKNGNSAVLNQNSGNTLAPNQSINNEDIAFSMDEYIKFNKPNGTEVKMETEQPTTSSNTVPLSEMISSIKMEMTDEEISENETLFENFFTQYGSALDFLDKGN